jgi:hypothetical protein
VIFASMRTTLILAVTIALLGSAGCKEKSRAATGKAPLAQCARELYEIPEVFALKNTRDKDPDQSQQRKLEGMEVALTINGMIKSQGDPAEGIDNWCASQNSLSNLESLLAALRNNAIPTTVAFVASEDFDPTVAERWFGSGNLLEVTTGRKLKSGKGKLQAVTQDIDNTERLLSAYWKKSASSRKYFRLRSLKSSRDPKAGEEFKSFLKQRGYVEVPATIEARDLMFTQLYCASRARGDESCASLVKDYFKSLLLDTTSRARNVARKLAGREVKHILMVGANQFTCDTLSDILAWYRSLGVKFISLDEALADPFYSLINEKGNSYGRMVVGKVKRAQRNAAAKDATSEQ